MERRRVTAVTTRDVVVPIVDAILPRAPSKPSDGRGQSEATHFYHDRWARFPYVCVSRHNKESCRTEEKQRLGLWTETGSPNRIERNRIVSQEGQYLALHNSYLSD